MQKARLTAQVSPFHSHKEILMFRALRHAKIVWFAVALLGLLAALALWLLSPPTLRGLPSERGPSKLGLMIIAPVTETSAFDMLTTKL